MESLRLRYRRALQRLYRPDLIAQKVGKLPKEHTDEQHTAYCEAVEALSPAGCLDNIFDFEEGIRLVISRNFIKSTDAQMLRKAASTQWLYMTADMYMPGPIGIEYRAGLLSAPIFISRVEERFLEISGDFEVPILRTDPGTTKDTTDLRWMRPLAPNEVDLYTSIFHVPHNLVL